MKAKNLWIFVSFLSAFVIVIADDSWARAGGGGGHGSGGILGIIVLPFVLISSYLIARKARQDSKETADFIAQFMKLDPSWDMDFLKRSVEKAFFLVQQAWMERNQDICREVVSDRLYEKHKLQTDAMLAEHRKNMLENINLLDTLIVQAVDYKDDSKDYFYAFIKGSMADYTVDTDTGKVVEGDSRVRAFCELWKFIKHNNAWVLDEIDQTVHLSDLKRMKSYHES